MIYIWINLRLLLRLFIFCSGKQSKHSMPWSIFIQWDETLMGAEADVLMSEIDHEYKK